MRTILADSRDHVSLSATGADLRDALTYLDISCDGCNAHGQTSTTCFKCNPTATGDPFTAAFKSAASKYKGSPTPEDFALTGAGAALLKTPKGRPPKETEKARWDRLHKQQGALGVPT